METQPTCSHIKTNGNFCQAVAMAGEKYCYFHLRDRQRHTNIRRAHNLRVARFNAGETPSLIVPLDRSLRDLRESNVMFDVSAATCFGFMDLPLLEDANAIQIALTNILRALAYQQVDRRTAGVMLYSIQIACSNLHNVRPEPIESIPATTNDPKPLGVLAAGELPEDKEANEKREN
jgi:hypothetical protein